MESRFKVYLFVVIRSLLVSFDHFFGQSFIKSQNPLCNSLAVSCERNFEPNSQIQLRSSIQSLIQSYLKLTNHNQSTKLDQSSLKSIFLKIFQSQKGAY